MVFPMNCAAPDAVDGRRDARRDLGSRRRGELAVHVGRVVPFGDAGRRREVPAPSRPTASRNAGIAGRGAASAGARSGRCARVEGGEDVRHEHLRVDHHRVGLDLLHVVERHRAARASFCAISAVDAPGAEAVVAGVQVVDAAARAQLVERVVVERRRRSDRCWR